MFINQFLKIFILFYLHHLVEINEVNADKVINKLDL